MGYDVMDIMAPQRQLAAEYNSSVAPAPIQDRIAMQIAEKEKQLQRLRELQEILKLNPAIERVLELLRTTNSI